MKRLLKKLENIYAAAAYSEAGEFETAKQIMREEAHTRKISRKSGSGYTAKIAVNSAAGSK